MIPAQNIVAWSQMAPWPQMRQVEQDLIIARALYRCSTTHSWVRQLRLCGGTALNKLHFPRPLRKHHLDIKGYLG